MNHHVNFSFHVTSQMSSIASSGHLKVLVFCLSYKPLGKAETDNYACKACFFFFFFQHIIVLLISGYQDSNWRNSGNISGL